jgi:TRAP-type uncharacterized transport system substrate-binding protein
MLNECVAALTRISVTGQPSASPNGTPHGTWYGKGLARAALLFVAAAAIAAVAASFGIARDYGYLHASILSGSPGGYYHTLATRLAKRAARGHGALTVVSTEGSLENASRLSAGRGHCDEMFGLIQDGTPVSAEANLDLLGRLPAQESLLLVGRSSGNFQSFADLRGASIGIGPEKSGTAYLMHQLFDDADLRQLGVHFSYHELSEQADLVGQGKLDVAAYVMEEDADLLRAVMRKPGLDIVAPNDLQGLVARYPWLSLGTIAAGRYNLVSPIPTTDKQVARLNTLIVAGPCARRADRVALLVLLAAELPGFVSKNPPSATSPSTDVALTPEARQFFLAGEPAIADRYFPWLVNLLSPAYWVYLVMTVTVLFNGMGAFSRFRLWRIDAAREKLEAELKDLVDAGTTHWQMREASAGNAIATPERRVVAEALLQRFLSLRDRCRRQTGSFVTPMGNEMYYRYQQSLIDEAITTLGALLKG